MSYIYERMKIPEVMLIKPTVYGDGRGFFYESFREDMSETLGLKASFLKKDSFFSASFVQDNHSKSKKNVLRGLHYQKMPFPQGKLIRCIKGRIFDVAVDIRASSPTFAQWVGTELSPENKYMFWIPEGFAHGFLSLEDDTEICYKCTNYYESKFDSGIIWNDPDINIDWGITDPILSEKDQKLKTLKELQREGLYV